MTDFSLAIAGSGGAGVVTAGQLVLKLAAKAGLYGLMRKSYGPQIRGGESVALLRIADHPVDCPDDQLHLLLALDWNNAERFSDEIPLAPSSTIIHDEKAGPPPQVFLDSGAKILSLPLSKMASSVKGGRANMVALGVLTTRMGLNTHLVEQEIGKIFSTKGEAVVTASLATLQLGLTLETAPEKVDLKAPEANMERWQMNGNEATGLGALRGGVRFVAAYPITPATDLLEWMTPQLEKLGGTLMQAEDELASINAIIGGSWGGVPSLTATSGPGLSLMLEALGLAVASETPLVVINVQRGGPSTGIPTKSEQTDLNIAIYGMHGDAPHLVLAPLSVADCVFTTQWASHLAESLQTPAVVLTDQYIGQSTVVIDRPPDISFITSRKTAEQPDELSEEPYLRYQLTANGIAPMAIPGTPQMMYTADGLEHDPRGKPSSSASDHHQQLDKRRDKLINYDYGEHWGDIYGKGELAIVTWGSSMGACVEAAQKLQALGKPTRVVALRLLSPLPKEQIDDALVGCDRIIVVEQNHQGQLFQYLHSEQSLPDSAERLSLPGPLTITPGSILDYIQGAAK